MADRFADVDSRIKKSLGDDYEVHNPTKDLGSDYTTDTPEGVKPVDKIAPAKGTGTRMYERLMGTDVHDEWQWTRLGTQIAGGVGGGMLGTEIGAAVGSLGGPVGAGIGAAAGGAIGGFAGSMAGTAAPEASMEIGEYLGILPKGTREGLALNNEDLKTVLHGEALLDMATGGGVIAARAFGRTAIRTMTGVGRAERKLADEAGSKNINLLPVQVGTRTLPRSFVAVLGKFPIVAGPIRKRMLSTEEAYKTAFDNLPADIAPLATLDTISNKIMTEGAGTWRRVSDYFGSQYEQVFKRADEAGARVLPEGTATKVLEITDWVKKTTPAAAVKGRKVRPDEQLSSLSNFLNSSVRPIFKATKSGVKGVAPQTFEQMDQLLTSIDTQIGEYGKKGWTDAVMRLEDLKTAIRGDMYTKIQAANPQIAGNIGADFQAIDKMYSETVADMFETSVAKRFGTVKRGGIRGAKFDPETRTNVEQLAEVLMRGGSTDDLVDLKKLISDDTFKQMASYYVDKQMQKGWTAGSSGVGRAVDLDSMSKALGLGAPNSQAYQYTKKMLELSGGMKIEDVEKLMEIGKKIGSVEAPNASTFVARRATMGGWRAIAGSLLPFMAGAGVNSSKSTMAGALISATAFFGGSRLLGKMITDPLAARSLKYVLKEETSNTVKRAAWLRAGQAAIRGMVDVGEYTEEEGMNLISWMKTADKYVSEHNPDTNKDVPSGDE